MGLGRKGKAFIGTGHLRSTRCAHQGLKFPFKRVSRKGEFPLDFLLGPRFHNSITGWGHQFFFGKNPVFCCTPPCVSLWGINKRVPLGIFTEVWGGHFSKTFSRGLFLYGGEKSIKGVEKKRVKKKKAQKWTEGSLNCGLCKSPRV